MAQLNTTAENLQWKSNMIIAGASDTDWASDSKYPSAKAVADKISTSASGKIEHPVGSVLITSTNANPGASVGGTWSLIDKEYKNEMTALTTNVSAWTAGSASLTSGYVIRANHSTRLKLVLTTTASLSTGASLGTISPATIGAGDIPLIAFGVSDLVDGIAQAVNKEGTKTYDIQYSINANGVVTITKIFNNETLPVGTVLNITTFIPMVQDFMADWACDKFYWKRLATQSSTSEPIETPASEGLEYTLNNDGISYSVSGIGTCEDTDIVIPSSYNNLPVTSIGYEAFSGCDSLESITIPDSVTSIGKYAFNDCSKLMQEENGVYYVDNCAIYFDNSTVAISLREGTRIIANNAFGHCSRLTSITIPESVTSIGDYAFYYCTSLTSITVDENNTVYHSAGNCLIETASKTLIRGCNNSVIPTDGSVTSIGDSAFSGCSGLSFITIPDSVTSIGSSAFSGCSSLTLINIPDSVISIGENAFPAEERSPQCIIYCEANSTPEGWDTNWNPGNIPVVWGSTM